MMPYRNQKLRDFAKDAPRCMYCLDHNEGQVVLAHSNSLLDGKGMGVKAHDIPAYLCNDCHRRVDEDTDISSDVKELIRLHATYSSILWLLETGRLVVGNPPYKD